MDETLVKTVCFVPAKGTSERVPKKNLRLLNGEPLVSYTLRKLLMCDFLDEVYLDSEDEEILQLGRDLGALTLKRDPSLSTNETDGHALFANEVRQVPDADVYVQVMCTSPFVKTETIRECVRQVGKGEVSSKVVVKGLSGYSYPHTMTYPNMRDLPLAIFETTGCYVMAGDAARESSKRVLRSGSEWHGYGVELIDIDTNEDFRHADLVAKGLHQEEVTRLNLLKTVLTSAALSDCGAITIPLHLTAPSEVIFGRAKTMQIGPNDGTKSVYEALKHYDYVTTGDVVVVDHRCGDLAYFGEVNARLAKRAGASGYLSNGPMRDRWGVQKMGFPFVAPYCTPQDVKQTACVKSLNRPVVMGGVMIQPHDLIFADADGVVVLRWQQAEQIIQDAMKVCEKESHVIHAVYAGVQASGLPEQHGDF